MYVVNARNVNEAFSLGLSLLSRVGEWETTRAGRALVSPKPVTSVYRAPVERVLFAPSRAANHAFHLAEAIWMLAGRRDGRFLDFYIHDFSSRFGQPEEDGDIHGAYGFRWRKQFPLDRSNLEEGKTRTDPDQLSVIIRMLRDNPSTRQAVLQMWDPSEDLGALPHLRDRPCNTAIYFRSRANGTQPRVLDMTISNRSNDAWFGAYGANAVHMSVLHEFIAAATGMLVGVMYQVSNNFHIYEWQMKDPDKLELISREGNLYNHYQGIVRKSRLFPIDLDWQQMLYECQKWCSYPTNPKLKYKSPIFKDLLFPMREMTHWLHEKNFGQAMNAVQCMQGEDWRRGCYDLVEARQRAYDTKHVKQEVIAK